MKFLTIGASGYIGASLHAHVMKGHEGIGTSSVGESGLLKLNLTRPLEFDFDLICAGDTIFFAAAISSPDECSRNFDRVHAINVQGTIAFISKALASGAKVIFLSSDTVYGEKNKVFDESEDCFPSGEYAVMKYKVESHFTGHSLFKSIRLSYVFSNEDKFTRYLIQCALSGKQAEIFHPFYRSVIHRDDVIAGVFALATRWDDFSGQFINFGGPEVLSRLDIADCFQRYYLFQLKYFSIDPGADFFKDRPRTIAMSSKILSDLLGRAPTNLSTAIQQEFN